MQRFPCKCGTCFIARKSSFDGEDKHENNSTRERGVNRAGVIAKYNGKFLLTESYGVAWGFPKGRIEGKETLEETASREAKEESGMIFFLNRAKKIRINNCVFFVVTTKKLYMTEKIFSQISSDSSGIAIIAPGCIECLPSRTNCYYNSYIRKFLN